MAVDLRRGELQALQEVLERVSGGRIELDVLLDRSVLGGVWVRVGDTVIDGSLRGRLEALRDDLRTHCRIILARAIPLADTEIKVQ